MATKPHPMSIPRLLGCSNSIGSMTIDEEQLLLYNSSTSILSVRGKELNLTIMRTNGSQVCQNQLEQAISAGYTSDDESSNNEEPYDSGRTRSSTRRANQVKEEQTEAAPARTTRSSDKASSSDGGEGKGKKRKKAGSGGDGSDSEPEDGQGKRRPCVEQVVNEAEELVCLCPKDVMTCIGILPSHPIISYFHESDDSDSSCNDDLTHTVLPTVTRTRRGAGGEGEG